MSAFSALKGQAFGHCPVPTTSFSGKTIIITGANSGLGLDCAKHLARLNITHLILACRSVSKGEAAKQSILSTISSSSSSSSPPPTISIYHLDLSSYASALSFADHIISSLPRLDGIICNAGVSLTQYTTAEGHETTLTVNVISTFLLAILLLPKLRDSAARFGIVPHIPIIGSMVHMFAKTAALTDTTPTAAAARGQGIFASLDDPSKADMKDRYNLSKLLVILCVRELVERIQASSSSASSSSSSSEPSSASVKKPEVVINNPAPGWCRTELFREEYATWPAPQKLAFKMIGRESEEGSRCLVHAVTAGKESQGGYLSECQVKPAGNWVRSKEGREVQKRVWKELEEILEGIKPGVISLI